MHKNESLYHYIISHATELTTIWINSLNSNTSSIYSVHSDINILSKLKEQNRHFIESVSKIFIEDKETFFLHFHEWVVTVARDRVKSNTPITEVITQFNRFRTFYWEMIEKFCKEYEANISHQDILLWSKVINQAFDEYIQAFITQYQRFTSHKLETQQATITELTIPVIPITEEIAVLPLIGDIDSFRATLLRENTLFQCSEKKISHLFIDFSGVAILDKMIAHHLFQLIYALKLLGIETTLSGMSPQVAKISNELGIDFRDITIKPNLAKALAPLGLTPASK
ncbi:STAS domain-containing protein [Neobacillus sp. D3-1R]|uniref:STAS domain-containing protein n=1 Tax=Neobacillus sp. D3-1R TaxID=3445778 RepID=UPI003FA0D713